VDPSAHKLAFSLNLAPPPVAEKTVEKTAREREDACFEELFQAALQPPAQAPARPQSGAELVYLLTGGTPVARKTQQASMQLPLALQAQAPHVLQPCKAAPLQRMDDFKRKIERMAVPASTLDVRMIPGQVLQVAKAPQSERPSSRTLVGGIAEQLKTFRQGGVAWTDMERTAKAGVAYVDRLAQRASSPAIQQSLGALREGLASLGSAASNLDNAALSEAEQAIAAAGASLAEARKA